MYQEDEREKKREMMSLMTVMLMGGVPGPQPVPLINASGLNGLLVPGVTDKVSHSNVS